MPDIRNNFVGIKFPKRFPAGFFAAVPSAGNSVSSLQYRYELIGGETGLLDDGLESAFGQGLVAMNGNADGADRRAIVTHNMVATANAVDRESKLEKRADGLMSGDRWKALRSHGQAAIVK